MRTNRGVHGLSAFLFFTAFATSLIAGSITPGNTTAIGLTGGLVAQAFSISGGGVALASVNATITSGYVTGDVLSVTTVSGYTSAWDATNRTLIVSATTPTVGNDATFSTIFQTLRLTPTSSIAHNTDRTISFTACPNGWYQYVFDGLPHMYYFVDYHNNSPKSFTNSLTEAAGLSNFGQGGYLATVTSQAEWDLVLRAYATVAYEIWLGGSDAAVEGTWKWVTGPETGTTFYNGGAVSGQFSYFRAGEPSQSSTGKDYLSPSNDGQWEAFIDTPTSEPNDGYVVEFGGLSTDILPSILVRVPNTNAIRQSIGF